MSYITISQASKILGKNKKTLFRWDQDGRFSPASREEVSKNRLYDEQDVQNLKLVLDNEKRFREIVKEEKMIQNELDNYKNILLFDKEGELLSKADKLNKKREEIVSEFLAYPQEIKKIHKIFFKI